IDSRLIFDFTSGQLPVLPEAVAGNFISSSRVRTNKMWRETKILLIDDNSERRRDLAVILNFLGEEHFSCDSGTWREAVAPLESSRTVLCVLLGDVQVKGGALELLKQL